MRHLPSHVSAFALAALALGGCASVTAMEAPAEPVLVVVAAAPSLPAVPEPPPPPPGPPPETPPPKVAVKPGALELLEPLTFGDKDSALAPSARPILDEVAELLLANPWIAKVSIEVHTDRKGSSGANRKLSLERADVLQAYLVAKGIDQSRLATTGHGEKKPLTQERSPEADAQNRRVELLIVEGEPPSSTELTEASSETPPTEPQEAS